VIGLYRTGTSPLHRCPVAAKLLVLLAGTTLLVWVRSPSTVHVGALLVLAGYVVARIPPGVAWQQLRPMRWFVVVLVALQWWSAGPRSAVVVTGSLVVAVLAAALVTLTTRLSAMLDVLESVLRPARRFGIDPDRVALVLALTIRAVPVLAATAQQVGEARRARGLQRSPRALLVPLVLRTLRHADQLGEALVARGVDD
jgi:biotin transport system permease protein